MMDSDNKDEFEDDNFDDLDNDDFEGIEDDAFDDFDETQKGSLKDVWQNNPLLKLAVVAIGIILELQAEVKFPSQQMSQNQALALNNKKKL